MATDKTKAEKEYTVEERLKALYELQTMLSEIDRIKTSERRASPWRCKTSKMRLQDSKHGCRTSRAEITRLASRGRHEERWRLQNSRKLLIEKYTAQQRQCAEQSRV